MRDMVGVVGHLGRDEGRGMKKKIHNSCLLFIPRPYPILHPYFAPAPGARNWLPVRGWFRSYGSAPGGVRRGPAGGHRRVTAVVELPHVLAIE